MCYDAVNTMLLNEFLEEHTKLEEQEATIADLKSTVACNRKGWKSSRLNSKNRPRKSKR